MTFTANQRLTAVLSVLAALAVTFIVAYNVGKDDTPLADHVLFSCVTEDVSESSGHTDDTAALLRSYGWVGKAGDGAERLYSPACDVPRRVSIAEVAATDPALADVLAEGDDNGDEWITEDESGWVSLP